MEGEDDSERRQRLFGRGYRSTLQAHLPPSRPRVFLDALFDQGPTLGLGFFEVDPGLGVVHLDISAARMLSGDASHQDGLTSSLPTFLAVFPLEAKTRLAEAIEAGCTTTVEGTLESGRFVRASLLFDPEPEGPVFGVLQDSTQYRRQIELAQNAQRLESVGRLAGGVAHDFNNLLTTILGSAELLKDEANLSEVRVLAEEIRMAGERGRELTHRLLALAHRRAGERKKTDLKRWLQGSAEGWRRLLGAGVDLSFELSSGRFVSWIDPGGLDQVMTNLFVNAKDAMEGEGRIEVVLELSGPPPSGGEGMWCTLRVCDDGPGMAPDVQARVLEPFFTTKELGQGTGLGLSTSYAMVRQFGGDLQVDSRPGRGTHVNMWFPMTEQEPTADLPAAAQATGEIRRQRILVLEDDRAVGLTITRMLERLGFDVSLVHDAAGAFAAVRSERVDLLVSDVVMPQTTGPAVARDLRAEFPRLKVLFVSGYAGSELERHGWDPQTPLLCKPFTADALFNRVVELIDPS